MRKHLVISLIMLALIAIPSYASAANLLSNPGFETGDLTDWNPWSPGSTPIYNWGRSGNYCAASWWGGGWQHVTIAQPDAPHTVGGYIFDDVAGNETMQGGRWAELKVEFKTAGDVIRGTWSTGNITGADLTDNEWNEFLAQVTPSDYGSDIAMATYVWLVDDDASGTQSGRGIFDDLIVDPVPEPSTILLLGTGLFGLVGLARKKIV